MLGHVLRLDLSMWLGLALHGSTCLRPSLHNPRSTTCHSPHRYVLWPRIDQKTCLKSIQASGYEPVVVPMRLEGDQLVTDVEVGGLLVGCWLQGQLTARDTSQLLPAGHGCGGGLLEKGDKGSGGQ